MIELNVDGKFESVSTNIAGKTIKEWWIMVRVQNIMDSSIGVVNGWGGLER